MKPRRPIFEKGKFYHIYNRGCSRLSLFHKRENYLFVLKKMRKYSLELSIMPIAYCLLPNHYHFLLRQDGNQRAGLFPQRVFNSYTKAFNKWSGHSGTLFEGPYKPIEVDSSTYLLHLCRYIHANPVKHGITRSLDEWQYSNWHEWIGVRQGNLFDPEFVNDHFPEVGSYSDFVNGYLADRKLPIDLSDYLKLLED